MRRLFSAFVVVALALGVLSVPPASAAVSWGAPIWSDEFNTTGVLNPDWYVRSDTYGSGNREDHWYRKANATVSNGALNIWTKKETVTGSVSAVSYRAPDGKMYAKPRTGLPSGSRPYSSAFLDTRDTGKYFPLYGKFEMKARVPHGQGLLPAFWLRRAGGASNGEVDILEYFYNHKPGYGKFTFHLPATRGHNITQQRAWFETPVRGSVGGAGGWHTWAMEITPAADPQTGPIDFTWYLDGIQRGFFRLSDSASIQKLHEPPADKTWDIAINTAVAGNWVGLQDQQLGYLPLVNRCSKSQKAPVSGYCDTAGLFMAPMPALFQIDYVRVYSRNFG